MTFSHDLPFDPTSGYTLDTLQQVPAPAGPADFADFWRDTYAQTLKIPTAIERRPVAPIDEKHDVFEIEFDSLAGRVGGWLAVPRSDSPVNLCVMGHGYGGRESAGILNLDEPTVTLSPCAAGFNRSRRPDVPDTSARHVLHGIESRQTYIHLFNVAELWSAAGVISELFPHAADRLFYYGTSFGGGLGAMMLPWDRRFSRAFLEVPSFGNIPLRLTLPCQGSGAAVTLQHQYRGDVMPVMQYFDAATGARFIQQPTLVVAALFDPAVAPPGQFAVYNAIPAEKKLFVKQAGHFAWPGEAEENGRMAAEVRAWFARA